MPRRFRAWVNASGLPDVLIAALLFVIAAQWQKPLEISSRALLWAALYIIGAALLYRALARFRWPAGSAAAAAVILFSGAAIFCYGHLPWILPALLLLQILPGKWGEAFTLAPGELETRWIRQLAIVAVFAAGAAWLIQVVRFRWNLDSAPVQCLAAAGAIAAAMAAGLLNRKGKHRLVRMILLAAIALVFAALYQNRA